MDGGVTSLSMSKPNMYLGFVVVVVVHLFFFILLLGNGPDRQREGLNYLYSTFITAIIEMQLNVLNF